MDIKKIILEGQDKLTSDEKDEQMVDAISKLLNTGPIIGDSRDALLHMSRNIMVRDLLLDAMGMPVEYREKMFVTINGMLEARDKEILDARKRNIQ